MSRTVRSRVLSLDMEPRARQPTSARQRPAAARSSRRRGTEDSQSNDSIPRERRPPLTRRWRAPARSVSPSVLWHGSASKRRAQIAESGAPLQLVEDILTQTSGWRQSQIRDRDHPERPMRRSPPRSHGAATYRRIRGAARASRKCPRTRGHIDMGHRPEVPVVASQQGTRRSPRAIIEQTRGRLWAMARDRQRADPLMAAHSGRREER